MRIAVLPADRTGCGSFRLAWPAEVVRTVRPDWEVELYLPDSVKIATSPNGSVQKIRGMNPRDLDLIVIQRVGLPGPSRFLDWAQEQGTAVVVDSDDAMWAIDRKNSSFKAWNQPAPGMHWSWLDRASDRADMTTVTTPYLAKRYGKHGRCAVLPNMIPEAVLEIDRGPTSDEAVAIGWMGFTATHPEDLLVIGDAVERTVRDTGAIARVVGDAKGAGEAWGVPVSGLGTYPLGTELYRAMSLFDIGVVPLKDSPFNRGKSYLKALEFSALGLPVVASPTPANVSLANDLPILLADSPQEWETHLTRLVRDGSEREERGTEARRVIQERFTLEAHAEDWAIAWEKAVERRRSVRNRAGRRKRTAVPTLSKDVLQR